MNRIKHGRNKQKPQLARRAACEHAVFARFVELAAATLSGYGRSLILAHVLTLLTLLSGCGAWGHRVEGRVLELHTPDNRVTPAANTFVYVIWHGGVPRPACGTTVDLHVALTTTDTEGRFDVPGWIGLPKPYLVIGVEPRILVYRPGFEYAEVFSGHIPNLHDFVNNPEVDTFELIKPSDESPEARFERLEFWLQYWCDDEKRETLAPLCRAIYEEARQLPPFPEPNPQRPGLSSRAVRLRAMCEHAAVDCPPAPKPVKGPTIFLPNPNPGVLIYSDEY